MEPLSTFLLYLKVQILKLLAKRLGSWSCPILASLKPCRDNRVWLIVSCSNLGVWNFYSTPQFSHGDGQTQATNKTIIGYLNWRLVRSKRQADGGVAGTASPQGLLDPTWKSIVETPSAMAYEMKVVIPKLISIPYPILTL